MVALRLCLYYLSVLFLIAPAKIATYEISFPPKIEAISSAAQLFSTKIVKTVAKEQSGNLIFSPLSTYIALSMSAGGAGGRTKEQLKHVLKIPSDAMPYSYYFIIQSLITIEDAILKLAITVFIQKGIPVKSEFLQDLIGDYFSDIESVNFREVAKAANTINTWCKEKTNGHIDSIVGEDDITPYTELVFTNAVYFKGNWRNKFNPTNTTDRLFYIDAGTLKSVPTMVRNGDYKYVALPEFEASCIELPYADEEFRMVIILPDKIDGLAALTDKLTEVTADCKTRLAQANKRYIQLYLPKFTTESKIDLTNSLIEKMGLFEPFSSTANFSGIADRDLHIDNVLHKAVIEVNEEGGEAADVTGHVRTPVSTMEFKVEHPFFYIIDKSYRDEITYNIVYLTLFVGRVIEPTRHRLTCKFCNDAYSIST